MLSKPLKLKPILSIISASNTESPFIAQIISIKKREKKLPTESDCYLTNISDSEQYIKCRFSNKASELISKNLISQYSLIKIIKYKIVRKENIIFLFVGEISEYQNNDSIIGSPISFGSSQINTTSINSIKLSNEPEVKKIKKEISNNIILSPIIQISPIRSISLTLSCISVNKSEKVIQCYLTDGKQRIKLIGFGETIKKLSSLLESGNIYTFNQYSTRLVRNTEIFKINGIFSLPESEYELLANKNIEIEHKGKDHKLITSGIINISEIIPDNKNVNIIGYIIAVYDIIELITKTTQKKIKKRDIKITDFSNNNEPIKVTLWEPYCNIELERNCVYFFGNLVTNNYNDIISLNSIRSTFIIKEPEIPQTKEIYKSSEGKVDNLKNEIKSIALIKDSYPLRSILRDNLINYSSNLNLIKINNFTTILSIEDINAPDSFYFACNECKKKVILEEEVNDLTDVTAHCINCNETKMCIPKVIMRMLLSDFSSSIYCTFFSDVIEELLSINSTTLYQMYINEPRDYNQLLNTLKGKQIKIFLKKSIQNYNGNEQEKYIALKTEFIEPTELTKQYLEILN